MSDKLTIEQRHRDAAAEYQLLMGRVTEKDAVRIRGGYWDQEEYVLFFARFEASLLTPKVGTALGLDEDGMCDDHYQFGCSKCVTGLRASTPTAQPTADAVGRARCSVCGCGEFVRIDVKADDGKFVPSTVRRCVGCKTTFTEQEFAAIRLPSHTMSGDYVMVPRERLSRLAARLTTTGSLQISRNGAGHEIAAMLSASPTGGE